jgi:hypothetical protein
MLTAQVLATLVLSQYARSRVDRDDSDSQCLWWQEDTIITVEQSATGNPETPGESEYFAVTAAFTSWSQQLSVCGSLRFQEQARTDSRLTSDDGRTLVLFRQTDCDEVTPACADPRKCGNERDCWEHANGALAITTTTYDPISGRISDSDIELNTPRFIFTTVDSPPCVSPLFETNCVASDVQNTLTHEVGHVLGLGHSPDPNSTMGASAQPGETSKRSLDADSKLFICDVYPVGKVSRSCKLPAYDGVLGRAKAGCTSVPGPVLQLWLWVLLLLGAARTGRARFLRNSPARVNNRHFRGLYRHSGATLGS